MGNLNLIFLNKCVNVCKTMWCFPIDSNNIDEWYTIHLLRIDTLMLRYSHTFG